MQGPSTRNSAPINNKVPGRETHPTAPTLAAPEILAAVEKAKDNQQTTQNQLSNYNSLRFPDAKSLSKPAADPTEHIATKPQISDKLFR